MKPPKEQPSAHYVFSTVYADAYRTAGYDVTEIRPGVWVVTNPREPRP